MSDADHNPVENLFQSGRVLKYKKGETLLRAFEEPRGVYLLEHGYVKVYALSKEGNENLHIIYRPGEIFPTLWVFQHVMHGVFYEALTPVEVKLLSNEQFLERINSNITNTQAVIGQLIERVRIYASRIDNLEYNNSHQRVAYRLLAYLNRFGRHEAEGWVIDIPLRHQQIASSLSMTRETAGRALERLQKKGIISYSKGSHLVVRDLDALARIIGIDEVCAAWPNLRSELKRK